MHNHNVPSASNTTTHCRFASLLEASNDECVWANYSRGLFEVVKGIQVLIVYSKTNSN